MLPRYLEIVRLLLLLHQRGREKGGVIRSQSCLKMSIKQLKGQTDRRTGPSWNQLLQSSLVGRVPTTHSMLSSDWEDLEDENCCYAKTKLRTKGGRRGTEVAFALPTQSSRVWFSSFLNLFRYSWDLSTAALLREKVDSPKCPIVVWTHLVLVSGKLVLQKNPEHSLLMNKACFRRSHSRVDRAIACVTKAPGFNPSPFLMFSLLVQRVVEKTEYLLI